MSGEFHLPDIGEGLEEAEIVAWLVSVGDQVSRDQPIVEVMTDKSNAELPAPWSGTVARLGGQVGEVLRVGSVLVVIEPPDTPALMTPEPPAPESLSSGTFQRESGVEHGERANDWPPAEPPPDPEPAIEWGDDDWPQPPLGPDPQPTPAVEAYPTPEVPPASPSDPVLAPGPARPKASPATRRAAAELGIDLGQIRGSGPGGRILAADLARADDLPGADADSGSDSLIDPTPSTASEPVSVADRPRSSEPAVDRAARPTDAAPSTVSETRVESKRVGAVAPLRGVRRVIAHNMARSWTEIPHIHASELVDAEPLLALRASLKDSDNPAFANVTPLAILIAAVASALDRYGEANAGIDMVAQTITYHGKVNIGVAVAAPHGLVVPVIEDAANRTLADLALELDRLVTGARADSLDRNDYTGGTATVTNFGALGGEMAQPLIRPPEAVIVGFGSIAKRPFVIEDSVVARSTMHVVIGADHRLLDGDLTTAVLAHITTLITKPIRLLTGV